MSAIINIIAGILIAFTAVGVTLSAGMWGVGAFSNNYTQSVNGKKGCLISFGACIILIAGYFIISLLLSTISTRQTPTSTITYQSKANIPELTLIITQDAITTQNESIFLSCMTQLNNPSQIQNSFGANYNFSLTAQLEASTFTTDTKEQTQQYIDQKSMSFNWVATPTLSGKQAININIIGSWTPRKEGKQIIRYLGHYLQYVNVNSEPIPFLTFGQVNIGTLLTAFLTAIISIPLWDIIRRRQEEKKENKQQKAGN